QEIYRQAYNSAYDEYADRGRRRGNESREETAGKVAWNAVKKKYQKGDDGKWHPKKK
ncbi:MAG: cation transport regulator, partial [Planctomycetes bacterium RBG_13_62_9]